MRRMFMAVTMAVLLGLAGCATTQAAKTEPPKVEQKDCPNGCDHDKTKAADCPEGGCPDCPDCPGKAEKKDDGKSAPGT